MPTTDAMKVQTVVMIRYAPHWDPESVSCTMKTHKTFTAVDKIITGIMLPRKNSSPFTEEVISVRSVFFSFLPQERLQYSIRSWKYSSERRAKARSRPC